MNLLVNASEAMRGRGHMKISLQQHASLPPGPCILRPASAGPFLEMSVLDSGPGIPAGLADRLFEPFFTTKISGAKVGTGLGLSLVYSIAQQAGLGLIVATEPGQGARFTVMIPVVAATVRETHSVQTHNPA
jgi:signal transduction histidine kinase